MCNCRHLRRGMQILPLQATHIRKLPSQSNIIPSIKESSGTSQFTVITHFRVKVAVGANAWSRSCESHDSRRRHTQIVVHLEETLHGRADQ